MYMLKREECELFSSGLSGAETAFGEAADKYEIKETVFTATGHKPSRTRAENLVFLSDEDLARGNVSMETASKAMNRSYGDNESIKIVLQIIFHVVNNGHQVFAVGDILDDDTVKGGTGWAVELAKLFNRPLSVFDQRRERWFSWVDGCWRESSPRIEFNTFVGSGTRSLTEAGRQAIEQLFIDSFEG